jgi:hypothetical protein
VKDRRYLPGHCNICGLPISIDLSTAATTDDNQLLLAICPYKGHFVWARITIVNLSRLRHLGVPSLAEEAQAFLEGAEA